MPHEADAEGKSVAYADGCVGGSLPHDDRPPRERATLREQSPDTRPVLLDAASHVRSQPKLTAAEMRRAVITAEVLSRPWPCGRADTGCKAIVARARPSWRVRLHFWKKYPAARRIFAPAGECLLKHADHRKGARP